MNYYSYRRTAAVSGRRMGTTVRTKAAGAVGEGAAVAAERGEWHTWAGC